MLLIGIDAATQAKSTGFALGHLSKGVVQIDRAGLMKSPTSADALTEVIVPALQAAGNALIAIDAPLGWPSLMAPTLEQHKAGDVIKTSSQMLFQRATDRYIREVVRKQPLEVGANLIARTAHAALRLLNQLRQMTGKPIPLAWNPEFEGVGAIEVYPAATLIAWGCDSAGYAKPANAAVRKRIADAMKSEIVGFREHADGPIDAFDACLCVLAAKDFLDGRAAVPQDRELAIREGWIWARRPV